jgi:hypothetical protein
VSTLQDGTTGPISWGFTRVLGLPILIDGQELDPKEALVLLSPGQVKTVRLLSGTAFNQLVLAHPHAPESVAPIGLTLTKTAQTVVDHLLQLGAFDRPFDLWLEYPIEERWRIRDDGRTVFTLSRPTAGEVVDVTATGPYFPRASIRDFPVENPANETALTVIESGVPAAGEILVDTTTRSTTIQTDDLSVEATGARALVFLHWPVRRMTVSTFQLDETLPQGVTYQLGLEEMVASVDYDAVIQP